ncbi:zf-HC2 domain-containing protein [Streptomyces sp. NPDC051776]|uniref:anti-sigma factor family protein n=1 Tax=Streptomyces sp. NPDC051776 TaxID=3155414 RepID=UPI0034407E22
MTGSGGTSHAEQHLGDRLAALVDGELEHDARERVLAHLATCAKCKAEADAQRRLKSVFAQTAPPPPSEGLLARLQGLPGTGDDGPGPPGGPGGPGTEGSFGSGGVFGVRAGGFAYVPAGDHGRARASAFRFHDVERSASRGRRFAFAAAGAVSLAALALGGALPLEAAVESASGRGEGSGATATPARTAAAGADGTASVQGGDALLAASASDGRPSLLSAPAMESGARVSGQPLFGVHHYFPPMLPMTTALSPLAAPTAGDVGSAALQISPAGTPAAPAHDHVALPSSTPEH